VTARVRACLSFWFGSWCQWATACCLFGIFRVLYELTAWSALRSTASVVAVAAGEFGLLIAAAAVIAGAVTGLWLLTGGPTHPRRRASRVIAGLGTAGAAIVTVFSLFSGWAWWYHRQTLLPLSPVIDFAVLAVMLGATAILLLTQLRRNEGLTGLAERLEAPSRRWVVLGLIGTIIASSSSGLRWLKSDRRPARNAARAPVDPARPNILLVTFDALSAEDMSLYGYTLPTTPRMDELARDSIVFEHFYSAGNHTTPSVTSLHTGVNVPVHGAFDWMGEADPACRHRNMAKLLREAGYITGAVVANPAAHPATIGIADDFDYLPPPPMRRNQLAAWAWHLQGAPMGAEVEELLGDRVRKYYARLHPDPLPETDVPPAAVFAQGKAFMDTAAGPWFLWLHLMVPHDPYTPPAPVLGEFGSVVDGDTSVWQAGLAGYGPYPPESKPEVDRLRLRYNEFIASSDAALGAFIAGLDRDGALKNTALFVSSDHGENFGHGFWGHAGLQMWEPLVHIPLIIRLPDRSQANTRIAELAGQVDLLPTILDLAGAAAPDWADGRSLRPLWEGRADPAPLRFSFVGTGTFQHPTRHGMIAVHEDRRKFVLNLLTGREMLFDRAADPAEEHDLSAQFPEDCARYRAAALAVIARHDRPAEGSA
jgi:arylsulfatase A-like enzyme